LKNKIQLKQEGKKDSLYDANSNNYLKRYANLNFFQGFNSKFWRNTWIDDCIKSQRKYINYINYCWYIISRCLLYTRRKKRDFKYIHEFLSKAKTNIINKLDSIYKGMTTIRFLYVKQIDSILNHIQGSSKINSFFRYILNSTESKEVKEGKKSSLRKWK